MKHDYESAMQAFKQYWETGRDVDPHHIGTINHALRFAAALMREPSEAMVRAAEARTKVVYSKQWPGFYRDAFKAMRDQLLKEVGNDGFYSYILR